MSISHVPCMFSLPSPVGARPQPHPQPHPPVSTLRPPKPPQPLPPLSPATHSRKPSPPTPKFPGTPAQVGGVTLCPPTNKRGNTKTFQTRPGTNFSQQQHRRRRRHSTRTSTSTRSATATAGPDPVLEGMCCTISFLLCRLFVSKIGNPIVWTSFLRRAVESAILRAPTARSSSSFSQVDWVL